MRRTPERTRAVVEGELVDAITRRRHAADQLDLQAYEHLAEHVNDLLDELHGMVPHPRPAG